MPAQKIRAIISDIGRVIVGVDVSRAMQGLSSGIALSPKEIWSAIEKDPRFPDLQEGRISARDWHLHIVRRLGGNLTYDQFIQAWNAALLPETLQPDSLWAGLAKKYRLALLSNTDPIHVAHMESTFTFFKYFPVRIYSCVVGLASQTRSFISKPCAPPKSRPTKPYISMTSKKTLQRLKPWE